MNRHLRRSGWSSIIIKFLPIISLDFFKRHFDSFSHEKFDKFLFADMSISVYIYLAEDLANRLLWLFSFKKFRNFLVADISAVVNVEVFEGALVVLTLQVALGIEGSDQKLGIFYLAWAIKVYQSQHHCQTPIVGYAALHYLLELSWRNGAVRIGVSSLEDFLKTEFLWIGQELRYCVCVNHCL